jgi:hypothetical protein
MIRGDVRAFFPRDRGKTCLSAKSRPPDQARQCVQVIDES